MQMIIQAFFLNIMKMLITFIKNSCILILVECLESETKKTRHDYFKYQYHSPRISINRYSLLSRMFERLT